MPTLLVENCESYQTCSTPGGIAQCVTAAGKCVPTSSKCVDVGTKAVCDATGTYKNVACPGCKNSALGATCVPVPTTTYQGKIQYEARGPNASYTDWGAVFLADAQQLYVVSYVEQAGAYAAIDSTTTGGDGSFEILFPSNPGPNDRIAFFALKPNADGTGVTFAVAQPDVPVGENKTYPAPPSTSDYWSWYADKTVLTNPAKADLTITEAIGSGAMRVYDYLRYIHNSLNSISTKPGRSVVVWLGNNRSWSCGACFNTGTSKIGTTSFQSQIFIPSTQQDTSFWSDAVNAHELGHWAMAAYGTSPGEGGGHCLSVPTFPGQAWSEGWATAHSSIARQSPVYFDKQKGSFFWLDISAQTYSNHAWTHPEPTAGLDQLIDENQVASMVYALSVKVPTGQNAYTPNKYLFDALSSPRMNTSPFGRGYTRTAWKMDSIDKCKKVNITKTSDSAPQVADYLDALLCGGAVSATAINAAVLPTTQFPFPTSKPICQ